MAGQSNISIDVSVVVAQLREQVGADLGRLHMDLAIARAERQTVHAVLLAIGELAEAVAASSGAERDTAVDALLAYLIESGAVAGTS